MSEYLCKEEGAGRPMNVSGYYLIYWRLLGTSSRVRYFDEVLSR